MRTTTKQEQQNQQEQCAVRTMSTESATYFSYFYCIGGGGVSLNNRGWVVGTALVSGADDMSKEVST